MKAECITIGLVLALFGAAYLATKGLPTSWLYWGAGVAVLAIIVFLIGLAFFKDALAGSARVTHRGRS